jgi:membrane-associated phospholipid phosphatase
MRNGSWLTALAVLFLSCLTPTRVIAEPGDAVSPIGQRSYRTLFDPDFDAFATATPSIDTTATASIDFDIQAQNHPQPQHTGFQALIRDTASDFASFPRRRSTWVILGIGGAAALLVHPIDDDVQEAVQDNTTLQRIMKPGKYLGYGPVQTGVAIGTYLIGRYALKSEDGQTNRVSHLGFDLLRANLLVQAVTYGLKYAVRRDRPTGECCAFPSGHASVTFAAASVLERHFGYRAAWPTFVIAGYVAAGRITENRHFLSDILFGSALGIACGWTVVGRHGRENFALLPVPARGGVALSGSWTFGQSHTMRTAEF